MKKIVVDTNVIFSAILNTNSRIGDLILNSDQYFKFYTAFYLRQEIETHQGKLIEISKLSEAELEESKHQIFKKINFLSEEQIPFEVWHRSVQYVRDVDMDDIAFVAMSEYLDVKLWTGDRELMKGLTAKGFERCISTKELLDWRKLLEEEE